MGLFIKSLIVLSLALSVPFAYRNYAPESTKATLSAYLANYKQIDNLLKTSSSYIDKITTYLDVEQLKQLIEKKDSPVSKVTQPSQPTEDVTYVDCKTENLDSKLRLFTKQQLAKHDGSKNSEGLLIAFLGSVYNVEKNRQYYGPGGDYAFFSGKDATRAFLTGNFNPDELTDNLDGVPRESFDEIQNWLSFYEDEYTKVGRLAGTFFDESGCPTRQLEEVFEVLNRRSEAKDQRKFEDTIFPECNSEWNGDEKKSRVWCSKMSGGIERDWAGVPRQLFTPETKSYRCACVRNNGPPSDIEGHTNANKESTNGDLDHPRLKQYDDCEVESVDCYMSQAV